MADNTLLAVSYYINGVNFRASADRLANDLEIDSDGKPLRLTAIPYYLLVSHGAELFLKAELLKRGFDEKDMKKFDYRHDLSALLSELRDRGVSVSSPTIQVVDGLNAPHKLHILRYAQFFGDGVNLYLPTLPAVNNMLDELFSLTRISAQGV